MDESPVELVEVQEHLGLLGIAEVLQAGAEEVVVLLLNVDGVERHQRPDGLLDVGQSGFVA